ncbi:hypothetical protein [Dictyobacter formicarum]|uniref:Transposase DDE domain-containing protein n=1 Tax=Dictyobacter formicarum TaxID=2778368 RepID=A0ABQ3VL99_9CHLR|nr:hypothetical protein [Dictyobacter formicarum]GHO86454.1 hypothetical protein KSZ_44600 [Dictyobacter formicarum]
MSFPEVATPPGILPTGIISPEANLEDHCSLPNGFLKKYRPSPSSAMAFDVRIVLWRLELGLKLLAYHRHDSIPDYFVHISLQFLQSLQEMRNFQ